MTTVILTTDEVKARLFELLAGQVTPKFISVKNYRNNHGETSDYVVNIGTNYMNAKIADTETLKNPACIAGLDFGNLQPLANVARLALLEAIQKPDSNHSRGQRDAYTQICNNVRLHDETGRLYINAMKVSKTVLESIDYGRDTRQPLTIAKDKIRGILKASKFRQYCIDKLVEIRMNGETLEFELA